MHCLLRISIPFYLHFEGAPSPKTQETKKSKDEFSSLGSISLPGNKRAQSLHEDGSCLWILAALREACDTDAPLEAPI